MTLQQQGVESTAPYDLATTSTIVRNRQDEADFLEVRHKCIQDLVSSGASTDHNNRWIAVMSFGLLAWQSRRGHRCLFEARQEGVTRIK